MTQSTGAQQDVTEVLTADHKAMLELLGQIWRAADAKQRRDIADTVIAEVMRHSVAEEMFVYPAIGEHLPNGAEEVRNDKRQHAEIVHLMKEMEGTDASSPAFLEQVRSLEEQLRHHAHQEESQQFPMLQTHLPQEYLTDMGRWVEQAKNSAPTRPHPKAPHSELFHKAVGPGVGMVDRLRDKLTGRDTS